MGTDERGYTAMTDEQELAVVVALVQAIAARHYDGELTLVRSSAGWQAAFGSPPTDLGLGEHAPSLLEALRELAVEPHAV
jgi:hypothetical protein